MPPTPEAEPTPDNTAGAISNIDVDAELSHSFLAYAMSVIISRALPDARDGMKPVHRRILYTMRESNLRPDGGYVKSARVVGNCMGRFHPHGDSAIYAAMVRLAQDFQMSVPLVDGHGNFGTLVDSAAASRYTECKMTAAAMALTDGIDEDTVDMVDNYDGRLKEPSVLPASFPNLLVNGTTGIAVGMATNILPHNLKDTVAAATHLLNTPDASNEDLADILIGPDLPSGGILLTPQGARDSYLTGRGAVTIDSVWTRDTTTQGKTTLTFTELPYQVAAERVLERINDLVRNDKLPEVVRAMDLTDRKHGLRLTVELRKNANVDKVMSYLNKHTPLRNTYHLHHLALINNIPVTATLRDLLGAYTGHRTEVVRRRSEYRRAKAHARLHILDGLLKALTNIDKVVAVIRASDSTTAARAELIAEFDMSERQANAVLEMPLRRLTSLETQTLTNEADELRATVENLTSILNSDVLLRGVVANELALAAADYPRGRLTAVGDAKPDTDMDFDHDTDNGGTPEPVTTLVSSDGMLRRVLAHDLALKPGKKETVAVSLTTPGTSTLGWITSGGHLVHTKPGVLPDPGMDPVHVSTLVDLDVEETVVAAIDLASAKELVFLTRTGGVKRMSMTAAPKRSAAIMKVADGDAILGAWVHDPGSPARLVVAASNSNVWSVSTAKLPSKGAAAGTVTGMKLPADTHILSACLITEDDTAKVLLTTVADTGDTHTSSSADYPLSGRGAGGVRGHKLRAAATNLVDGFFHRDGNVFAVSPRAAKLVTMTVTARGKAGRAAQEATYVVWPGRSEV
jgi:DNA gyrase subunit A